MKRNKIFYSFTNFINSNNLTTLKVIVIVPVPKMSLMGIGNEIKMLGLQCCLMEHEILSYVGQVNGSIV